MREYEIKVLNIDDKKIIDKLEQLSAYLILDELTEIEWYDFKGKDPSILKNAKRTKKVIAKVYDFLKKKNRNSIIKHGGYLRLRKQNGYDLTFKYKDHEENDAESIEPFKEFEAKIAQSDIPAIRQELISLNFFIKTIHQKKRVSYRLNNIRFDIDTWPGMAPYLEIEASNPQAIKTAISLLGLTDYETTQESGVVFFKKYNINFWSTLSFNEVKANKKPANLRYRPV